MMGTSERPTFTGAFRDLFNNVVGFLFSAPGALSLITATAVSSLVMTYWDTLKKIGNLSYHPEQRVVVTLCFIGVFVILCGYIATQIRTHDRNQENLVAVRDSAPTKIVIFKLRRRARILRRLAMCTPVLILLALWGAWWAFTHVGFLATRDFTDRVAALAQARGLAQSERALAAQLVQDLEQRTAEQGQRIEKLRQREKDLSKIEVGGFLSEQLEVGADLGRLEKADKVDRDALTDQRQRQSDTEARIKSIRAQEELALKSEEDRPPAPSALSDVSLLATRVAPAVLLLYLVQILLTWYRQMIGLASFYDARADALQLARPNPDGDDLDTLIKMLTPDNADLGKVPVHMFQQVVESLKEVAARRVDRP